jgi:PTS system fructose-specific IIC component
MPPGTLLPVADFFTPARIALQSTASDKDAVLAELVALALPEGPERDGLLADVRKREAQFTTALGDGIALPHARSRHVDTLQLAAVQLAAPVAFGAADGVPVQLAFLVASPADAPGEHLVSLRGLSRLFDNRASMAILRSTRDVAHFLDVLRHADAS